MAALVAHHQAHDVAQQRILGRLVDGLEGGERQALDEDLHADELQVPTLVGEHLVEQELQARIDRVDHPASRHQILVKHLDVARLVEGLGRGIELGVMGRRAAHQLGGDHQGALFAVQELRQRLRTGPVLEIALLLWAQRLPLGMAGETFRPLADHARRAGRRRLVPVDVELGIPVEALAEFVKPPDLGIGSFVVPVVGADQRGVEDLPDDLHIVVVQALGQVVIVEILDLGRRAFDDVHMQHGTLPGSPDCPVCEHPKR